MPNVPLTPDMLDSRTPPDVIVTTEAPPPFEDPTLGITVNLNALGTPRHRLVTIGDSLTHGFQSGAIYNTSLSYPAMIADALGWLDHFRFPRYPGFGGLPLNIEFLARQLEQEFGAKIDWWEVVFAGFRLEHLMAEIEDWWERGPGSQTPNRTGINHNLGVYGWDLRDVLDRNALIEQKAIEAPKHNGLFQLVENANERAALRVLPPPTSATEAMTPLQAAAALGAEGTLETENAGDGIETLVVMLGGNNALQAMTKLEVVWSAAGYDTLAGKDRFTVWNPVHFQAELDLVVAQVRKINARHVIWATVPHVTIIPIGRGVGTKVRPDSRYFPYYTRPWIQDSTFDAKVDPHITAQEARAVDSAIDQYNQSIAGAVRDARNAGKDWYVLDICGILDRLASRRYLDPNSINARPDWWTPYPLPKDLDNLTPRPDSHFFASDTQGRVQGGLFTLDGVHPTTITYGIIAQEIIRIMVQAGVAFYQNDGVTPRTGPIDLDFKRLIALDTLISDPPRSVSSDMALIGWFDSKLDVFRRLFRHGA